VKISKMMVDRMSEFMRDHLSDLTHTCQSVSNPAIQTHAQFLGDDKQIAKDELPNDSPRKRDVPQVVLRVGRLPHVSVLDRQDGDDGADDLEVLSVLLHFIVP
jgi:hypothetical protein